MKVALYIRVSTDEQAEEGYSIAAQRDRLLSFCHSQGWEVVETYLDDGESAKDLDRPDLKRLLTDLETSAFDVVLVYRLDRLTRSVIDLYTLLQRFETYNVKFKSATEVYDTTTAIGRLFITLVAALAQWERENLGERVRFGMEQMIREGKRPGGPIPFGYDKDERIIPEEAKALRMLRKLYMEGLGFKQVAVRLNEMGMTRRGYKWGTNSVWYVLDNPYYAGKFRWGGKKTNGKYASRKKEELVDCIIVDAFHEKIFTWEEYEEHTARMKRRSFSGYTKKREYWFTGVLRCAKCGSKMSGRYHKNKKRGGGYNEYQSYICAKRQEGKGCTMPMFRQELVEHLIMDYIEKIKIDHSEVKSSATKDKQKLDAIGNEIEQLQMDLSKIEERRKKWQYMFVEELISTDDLRKRRAEEDENEKVIRERLDELKDSLNETPNEKRQLLIDLSDMWSVLDDLEKSDLIQTIFEEITLYTPLDKAHGKKGEFIPASIQEVKYN